MLVIPLEQLRNVYEWLGLQIQFEGNLASRFVGVCALHGFVRTGGGQPDAGEVVVWGTGFKAQSAQIGFNARGWTGGWRRRQIQQVTSRTADIREFSGTGSGSVVTRRILARQDRQEQGPYRSRDATTRRARFGAYARDTAGWRGRLIGLDR